MFLVYGDIVHECPACCLFLYLYIFFLFSIYLFIIIFFNFYKFYFIYLFIYLFFFFWGGGGELLIVLIISTTCEAGSRPCGKVLPFVNDNAIDRVMARHSSSTWR